MATALYNLHFVQDEYEGGPAILVDFGRGVSACSRAVLAKKYRLVDDVRTGKKRVEMLAVPDWSDIPAVSLGNDSYQGTVRAQDVGGDSYRDGGRLLIICRVHAIADGDAEQWLEDVADEMRARGLLLGGVHKGRQKEEKGCCVVQ